MDEYRIEIKVKNNLLYSAVMAYGYPSLLQFCEKEKVAYGSLGSLINMTKSALDSQGNFTPFVLKLCEKLRKLPEELFSATQLETELETNKFTKTVQEAEMRFMLENQQEVLSPDMLLQHDQMIEETNKLVETLTPREQKVINLRFGLDGTHAHTLEEVSKIFGVNRERIRQIEAKALRKLRHPSRAEKIRQFIHEDED